MVSLTLSLCTLIGCGMLYSNVAHAETLLDNIAKPVVEEPIQETHAQTVRSAGVVMITCKSGANIRSGPGLNYRKIGVANWGAEISCGRDKARDSRGVLWYHINDYKGIKSGWVSSEVAYEA